MDAQDRWHRRLLAAEAAVLRHYGVVADTVVVPVGGGAQARVLRVGTGPPVVLLHGAGLSVASWAPLVPRLPGRTCLLVDLPGCGLSSPSTHPPGGRARGQAAFLEAVLDGVGLARTPLIGASLGGLFGLRLALARPERVAGLGLLGAPGLALPGARVPAAMALASRPSVHAALQRLASSGRLPGPRTARRLLVRALGRGTVAGLPPALLDAMATAMAMAAPAAVASLPETVRGTTPLDVLDVGALTALEPPVLWLWGDRDTVQGPDAGRRAVAALPDGRLEVLPGGHALWLESPERCGRHLSAFLDGSRLR